MTVFLPYNLLIWSLLFLGFFFICNYHQKVYIYSFRPSRRLCLQFAPSSTLFHRTVKERFAGSNMIVSWIVYEWLFMLTSNVLSSLWLVYRHDSWSYDNPLRVLLLICLQGRKLGWTPRLLEKMSARSRYLSSHFCCMIISHLNASAKQVADLSHWLQQRGNSDVEDAYNNQIKKKHDTYWNHIVLQE